MKLQIDPIPQDQIDAAIARKNTGRVMWSILLGRNPAAPRAVVVRMRGFFMVVIALVLALPALIWLTARGWTGAFWIAAIDGFLLFAILKPLLLRAPREQHIQKLFASDPQYSDPVTIEVDDAGFLYANSRRRLTIAWSIVRLFRETQTVFVLIDDEPTQYIVPKRAFASPEQCAEFEKIVLARAKLAEPFKSNRSSL